MHLIPPKPEDIRTERVVPIGWLGSCIAGLAVAAVALFIGISFEYPRLAVYVLASGLAVGVAVWVKYSSPRWVLRVALSELPVLWLRRDRR